MTEPSPIVSLHVMFFPPNFTIKLDIQMTDCLLYIYMHKTNRMKMLQTIVKKNYSLLYRRLGLATFLWRGFQQVVQLIFTLVCLSCNFLCESASEKIYFQSLVVGNGFSTELSLTHWKWEILVKNRKSLSFSFDTLLLICFFFILESKFYTCVT